MPSDAKPEPDAPWDFQAALEDLLVLQGTEGAWKRWDELHDAAVRVVGRGRTSRPGQLQKWLDDNAEVLIGQQMLVHAVHRERPTEAEMTEALRRWLTLSTPGQTPADAVAWLQREEPALMRAWMLSHLQELVARELEKVRSGPV